ncbi:MAG: hybrid sensor histidine kinase/response regulator [Thiobacillaceae bacterium]
MAISLRPPGRKAGLWKQVGESAGIRTRILFIAILPSMLIAAALTVYFTHQMMQDMQRALDSQARQSALILAASGQYALISGNQELLAEVMRREQTRTDLSYAAIYDRTGPLKAQLGAAPLGDRNWPEQLNDGKGHLIDGIIYRANPIELPKLTNSNDLPDAEREVAGVKTPLGYAVVGVSTQGIVAQKNSLLVSAGFLLLAALAATISMVWRLSARLSGQIRHISKTVHRIAKGELSVRASEGAAGEIGQLGRGINQMAQALYENRSQLEDRILEATARLAAQRDKAERASIAKSKFFAAASHDLRQPLHALVLFVGALKARIHYPEVRTLVEHIEASVDAMEMLFNSLLDISRLDAGVIEINRQHFAVDFLLERLKKQFAPQATEKGLKFRVLPCGCTLYSDPILLERIILNLVSNAIRYTDRGGILVGCRRRGKNLLIQVWDSGQGIPDEQQETVFQEFFQLNNPERDRSKGLGLGLAIVARLAILLDLPISLSSRHGRGTVFGIQVPLGSALLAEQKVQPHVEPSALGINLAVLIDDEDAILRAMEELFDSWNIDLVATRSLEEAIQVLNETGRAPDIIMSDYRLPGNTDGLKVLAAMRHRYGATLPAIILTGDTSPESIQIFNQAGFTVLHKPLRPARLRSLLIHLFRQAAKTQ